MSQDDNSNPAYLERYDLNMQVGKYETTPVLRRTKGQVPWTLRCLTDNLKGVLPFQAQLRSWKRRLTGYRVNVSNQPCRLAEGLKQIEWLTQHLGTLDGMSVLKIGSGWEPMIPL